MKLQLYFGSKLQLFWLFIEFPSGDILSPLHQWRTILLLKLILLQGRIRRKSFFFIELNRLNQTN